MKRQGIGYVEFIAKSQNPRLTALIEAALETSVSLLRIDFAQAFLFDGETLVPVSSINVPKRLTRLMKFGPGDNIINQCLAQAAPLVCRDVAEVCSGTLKKLLRDAGIRGTMAVPMKLGDTPFGVVALASRSPRDFSRQEVHAIENWAHNLSLGLHHIAFFPELSEDWLRHLHDNRFLPEFLKNLPKSQYLPKPPAGRLRVPKGINLSTLYRISIYLVRNRHPVSRRDAAEALGVSEVTVGRYLTYLKRVGIISTKTVYGTRGRPKTLYFVPSSQR